ncbi:MAG: hypothetical protein ACQEUZ_02675 [Pseudomonadota bacterium]
MHIGLPTAGSKLIQRSLAANRRLLERSGFDLSFVSEVDGRSGDVAKYVISGAEDILVERIRFRSTNDVILSSEDLFGIFAEDERSSILTLLGEAFDVVLHVWLRRQDFLKEAMYREAVKAGFSGAISEEKSFDYDLNGRLAAIERLAGLENIRLYLFREDADYDPFLDFMEALGVEAPNYVPVRTFDPALNRREVIFLSQFVEESEARRRSLARVLQASQGQIRDDGAKAVMSPDARKALMVPFLDGNREIARRYGLPEPDARWFCSPPSDDPDWTPPDPASPVEQLLVWKNYMSWTFNHSGRVRGLADAIPATRSFVRTWRT